jgi:hydrogenase/urease accessory protein HupE
MTLTMAAGTSGRRGLLRRVSRLRARRRDADSASPALYALGFAVSTAGLHVLGALTGLLALCRREGHTRLRWAGVAIGLAGLCFVTAVVR